MRVHHLAKELGVTSKDVVSKCQAEDIPTITNHMSTVSLGLAETIRDWFSSGGTSTAVQTAAPVDIEKARARARKKATKKTAKKAAETTEKAVTRKPARKPATAVAEKTSPDALIVAPETAITTAPPPLEVIAPEAPAEIVAEPEVEVPAPEIAAEVQIPELEPASAAVEAEVAPETPVEEIVAEVAEVDDELKPIMNIPDRPKVIKPAGPMLEQPDKVSLAGPKIIRVESPDVVPAPQPRMRGGGAGAGMGRGGPRGGSGVLPEPGMPVRGGGGRTTTRRNKRRSASAREEAGRTGRQTGMGAGEGSRFNWREQDLLERERRLNRSGGFFRQARRDNQKRSGGGQRALTAAQSGGSVKVEEPITVKALSAATGVKAADILKKLLLAGSPASINGTIETEQALEIMAEYGIDLEVAEQKTVEEQIVEQFEHREMSDERPRPPVITILGHVDHGKTSLLDSIRHTDVAGGEAGGITQATSAFQVSVHVGDADHLITFIDTPGHEAFTEMRARGAKVTDIVVLVVAADDGVMPQTAESISHAKAAGVPIIVALNKVDKPEATDSNIQRILGQLAEHELNPVEWGGSTEIVRTSAIKSEGIQDLLEIIDYQAQLLDLKADFGGNAEGTVIEARLEEGRGAVANVLVQQGHLSKGDFIVMGRAFGRVRDIVNERGQRIPEAGPSMAVAVSGINEVPDAGDKFYTVKSLKAAEAAAEERRELERERELAQPKVTLSNWKEMMAQAGRKELPLILKADVKGSVDTLKASLEKISTDDVSVSIKHCAVGGINDSDILLADTTGAVIIGFNVTASAKARKVAEAKSVDVRLYDVIYDVTDDVTKAAEGLLEPEYRLEVLGHAEVRQVFKVSKVGMIAGCYVTDGVIERNAQIRVTREDIVIEKDRRLEQLKRFKDDAKEVRAGQECGMRIDGYDDIKAGDVLECYKTLEVRRTL
ncbi:MAG: translation initiation factor IF-2 [Planctomycetota bacterium]